MRGREREIGKTIAHFALEKAIQNETFVISQLLQYGQLKLHLLMQTDIEYGFDLNRINWAKI